MTEKTLTTENIKPALDALRGELAPWPVVAKKQDRLNTAQLNAANSGITSSLVAQIIANTAAIRALESAITGTGLRALVVSSLPAIGTQGILYIVPVTTYDPDTDADVVNYSNEYIWIPVEGGTASEGHYEQVGQTGIVINNGQLNITVNGTSVGTFTANQSGDTTAAITVPTNADYVDRTTDQTVAGVKTFSSTINGTASKAIADEDGTSIKTGYVNVAGNQTVTGDKSFTGSNTFNNILPNATSTYSLGSSSYQWASVYSQTYYYNGTAWGLDKANVWSASNTFNQAVISNSSFWITSADLQAKNQSTLTSARLNKIGNESSDGKAFQKFEMKVDATYSETAYCVNYYNTSGNIAYDFVIRQRVDNQGTKQFYPSVSGVAELGTSANQWSSVYAQSYYYNGTAWGLDKANTWTNTNTFQQNVTYERTNFFHQATNPCYLLKDTELEKGSTASTAHTAYPGLWHDKNGAVLGYMRFVEYDTGKQTAEIRVSNLIKNGALDPTGSTVNCSVNLELQPSGEKSLIPEQNNDINLGTSTNKWKSLNGVNPGALSLPDYSKAVNIGTTNWSTSGAMITYTPIISGWLQITVSGGSGSYITILDSGTSPRAGQRITGDGIDRLFLTYPVVANRTYWIYIVSASIETARIIPCLGNV